MNTYKILRKIDRQDMSRLTTQVQDLRHGMKKVNLEAEVVETTKPALVHTQWGNSAMVTNALIADSTGKIKLCLWNEQVNSVNIGDTIQIKNATVFTYKGERQLRLAKNGTITLIQSQVATTPTQRIKAKPTNNNF
jgi:replication factor A1